MKLWTTREEREEFVSGRERYPLFNDKELSEDANSLEDELARVRDALADARSELNKAEDELGDLREQLKAAHRVVAWLRSGPYFPHGMAERGILNAVYKHLESSPPSGWQP